jgi:hypothetical protein
LLQLDRWSDTDNKDSGRKQLQLIVPPGQQELGQRLITAMYADTPDLSDLSPLQLVQLVLLAESYDVSKVVAAAAEAMGRLRPEQLTAEAISAVLLLPDSCLELDCFKQVKVKAGDQLQQQYGDLEVVWGDEDKAEQLLALPYAAILQLVQDSRTRVASEDTIVYTIGRWLEEHPDTSSEQKEQLADTVRLPLCSATFLSSSDATAWLLEAGYTEQDLRTACVLQGKTKKQQAAWVSTYCESRTAWNLQRRASTTKWDGKLVWKVSLADVRSTFDKQADSEGVRRMHQPAASCIWHGREWPLYFQFDGDSNSIGMYLQSFNDTRATVNGVLKASRTAGEPLQVELQAALVGDAYTYGSLSFVRGPSGSRDWGKLEARLRQALLVHDDGCLHLEATVSGIA